MKLQLALCDWKYWGAIKRRPGGKRISEGQESTHVWLLRGVLALNDIPQHIYRGIGLDRDTSLHTLLMNVANQLLGACPSGGLFICRIGRGNGGDRSLVVEAVQIATGILELADPFMRLLKRIRCQRGACDAEFRNRRVTNLHNHHVAIECAPAGGFRGTVYAAANLRDNWAADGHVWHEVAVHDVNMEPVGALLHLLRAVMAQVGEVGTENGGSDDRGRCHDV